MIPPPPFSQGINRDLRWKRTRINSLPDLTARRPQTRSSQISISRGSPLISSSPKKNIRRHTISLESSKWNDSDLTKASFVPSNHKGFEYIRDDCIPKKPIIERSFDQQSQRVVKYRVAACSPFVSITTKDSSITSSFVGGMFKIKPGVSDLKRELHRARFPFGMGRTRRSKSVPSKSKVSLERRVGRFMIDGKLIKRPEPHRSTLFDDEAFSEDSERSDTMAYWRRLLSVMRQTNRRLRLGRESYVEDDSGDDSSLSGQWQPGDHPEWQSGDHRYSDFDGRRSNLARSEYVHHGQSSTHWDSADHRHWEPATGKDGGDGLSVDGRREELLARYLGWMHDRRDG
eukprot:207970_1